MIVVWLHHQQSRHHRRFTDSNMNRMEYMRLFPRTKNASEPATTARHPFDWSKLPACVSIDRALPCTNCTALLDPGVHQAYITVPLSVTLRRRAGSLVLVTGSDLQITFRQPSIASENFVLRTDVMTGVTPREFLDTGGCAVIRI